jgi:hypothetical protein
MRCGILPGFALGLALVLPAGAAVEISTDVTVDLAGTVARDQDVVEDTGSAIGKVNLGTIPSAADLAAYSVATDGDVLFALDVTTELPGGVTVTPRDVVRWNESSYSLELRGADHGVPAGAAIDAIGVVAGDLLLSFDVTVTLGGVVAQDEDLLRLEGTQPDAWSLFFDGSVAGVSAGADLDGADLLDENGHLALSFDVSGSVGGVAFDDEDILEFDPGPGTWSKRYDGTAARPALAAADVDAVFVPEPGAVPAGTASGIALGLVFAQRAARRSRSRTR